MKDQRTQVPGNARARRFSKIHPDVQPVRIVEIPQRLFGTHGQPHHLRECLGTRVRQRRERHGPDEQHEGERHFRDHESALQPMAPAAGGARRIFAQRFLDPRRRGPPRRHRAECDSRDEGEAQGECEDGKVESDLRAARQEANLDHQRRLELAGAGARKRDFVEKLRVFFGL